ncbi:hypothetical protein R1flu_006320 [Riccia fluitans]|uniref:Uncharacterized protein n=1 Tax=Riccia fluitans TaxID=41844 RepID=A0ABD1YVP1_9MARC
MMVSDASAERNQKLSNDRNHPSQVNEEPAFSDERNPTKNNKTHVDIIINATADKNKNSDDSSEAIEELSKTKDENAATNAHYQSMTSIDDEDEIPIIKIDEAKIQKHRMDLHTIIHDLLEAGYAVVCRPQEKKLARTKKWENYLGLC